MTNTPDPSPHELFQFACGDLDRQRAALIRRRVKKDLDLAAKAEFFRLFVPDDILNPRFTLAFATRLVILSSVWGIAIGVVDNYVSHILPLALFKPVLVASAMSLLAMVFLWVKQRLRQDLMQGSLVEAAELTLVVGVPIAFVLSIITSLAGLLSVVPWIYLISGIVMSGIGVTRGLGLRLLSDKGSPSIPSFRRIGRGMFYAFYLAPLFIPICGVIIVTVSRVGTEMGISESLIWQTTFVCLLFAAGSGLSFSVRNGINDEMALKLDWHEFLPYGVQEGLLSLCIGPLVGFALWSFSGVFGVFHLVVTIGIMILFVTMRFAQIAIHGAEDTPVPVIRSTVVVFIRRAVKMVGVIVASLLWRVLLLDRFGSESLLTFLGLFPYVFVLIKLEKVELRVERVLFPSAVIAVRKANVVWHGLRDEARLLWSHYVYILGEAGYATGLDELMALRA